MKSNPKFIQDKILGGEMAASLARLAAASSNKVEKKGAIYSTKEDMSVEGGRRDSVLLKEFDGKLI